MLNYIWAFMILGGLSYGVACGQETARAQGVVCGVAMGGVYIDGMGSGHGLAA